MNSLPRETLEIIFSHLSKRYRITVCSIVCKTWRQLILNPSFYYTIHFYSQQQLVKFINLAKQHTINNKLVGHYVQHLIFHYDYLLYKNVLLAITKALPNIHSIKGPKIGLGYATGLSKNDDSQYQQLTHIDLWFVITKRTWMKTLLNNKEKVESLFVPGTIQTFYSNDPSPFPPIHFKPFGQLLNSTLPSYTSCYSLGSPRRAILILPILNMLTTLCIYFPRMTFPSSDYYPYVDKYTIESIHQSCPSLISLSLQSIFMTKSEDINEENDDAIASSFNDIIKQNDNNIVMFQKSYQLKELEIGGRIMDASCFTYFSKKYPQLESLKLSLNVLPIPIQIIKSFQFAMHNMMAHLQLLKRLNLELKYSQHEMDALLQTGMDDKSFWPNNEFLEWLLQFPTQLTHFAYYNEILEKWNQQQQFLNNNSDSTDILKNYYQDIINKIIHQPNALLNHLIYLKLTTKLSRDILHHYILQQQNENSIVLSLSIKELIIDGSNEDKREDLVCITDWLDTFPNLTLLKLKAIGMINDGEDLNKDSHDFILKNKDNIYVHKSHEMIKQKKQLQQQNLFYNKNDKNDTGTNSTYKLKYLTLQQCTLSIKNGLNVILNKCPHLKRLVLDRVLHSFLESGLMHNNNDDITSSALLPKKEITFDLSQYQLELLVIKQLSFFSWGKYIFDDSYIVNKLLIYETIPDNKRTITRSGNVARTFKGEYTLSLKCKYIDELVFSI